MFSICNAISVLQCDKPLDYQELAELVGEYAYRGIEKSQLCKAGWAPPVSLVPSQFVYETDRFQLIRWLLVEKILPKVAIDNETNARVRKIEEDTGAPVPKKQRQQLQDEAITYILSVLPESFRKEDSTYLLIDKHTHRLYIMTTSGTRCDDVCAYLRKTIARLPAQPLLVEGQVGGVLAQWVMDQTTLPEGFSITGDAVLKSLIDDSRITCKNEELDSAKIQAHLKGDDAKWPVSLVLNWNKLGSFTIACSEPQDPCFVIKSIKFNSDIDIGYDGDDPVANFDAEFVLCSALIVQLIDLLTGAMSQPKTPDEECSHG
ncbi:MULTISPECIES: recombination-associated protein RdgC [Aeromonas]|uniref:recombination-associated protein RdgC n=1 Tax=Aeromonas TaxID=642 RepID=UPI0018825DD2|nr:MULTISPECIES: recombination-associated protein RdgC [Aeromonas]MDU7312683.1 recombination-associated protein RdgC [Aeromonas sp.]MBJ7591523.1 recombination-associated protein RdgC [Aeromonas veronii]MBL0436868.1 recombination-associated protein RdgC [Aeromonas caviae]MCX4117036.1 recombination-associated protein RdgC [Aeromonas hydrophila]MDH1848072.1 recombination-associated protein RdgC [Aeromonas caviae]